MEKEGEEEREKRGEKEERWKRRKGSEGCGREKKENGRRKKIY